MTPTETTTILRQFNKWLRGNKDGPQLESREIGKAIAAAVEMIERMDGALESLLIHCNDVDILDYIDLTTSFVRDTVRIARGEQE